MKHSTALQQLFKGPDIFVIPGGACALHARFLEAAGFACVYMSGAQTSAHIFGIPDAGLITMTEMVQNAGRMARAVNIPLISDADQGFGNAVNTRRTVQEFIWAGVAGIHIEDQPMPKRCGNVKGKRVISIDEAIGKYRAAVDAKRELDPDFVIIARCDARGAAGGTLEEVIQRLKAYKSTGVDVLYFEQPLSLDEIKAVRREVEGPLMATTHLLKPAPTVADLAGAGLSAAFLPGLIMDVALRAAWDYAHDFMRRGEAARQDWNQRPYTHPMPHVFDIVGFPKIFEWEQRYLPAEEVNARYETSVGGYDPRTGGSQRSPAS